MKAPKQAPHTLREVASSGPSAPEPNTANILASFRAELVANQKQVLSKLDKELDKARKMTMAAPAPMPEFREVHEFLPGSPQPLSPMTPKGAWGAQGAPSPASPPSTRRSGPDRHEESPRTSSAHEGRSTFARLWQVAEHRKMKMPWIHKQKTMVEKLEEYEPGSRRPSSSDNEDHRAFSQMNRDYAREQIRKKEIAEFNPTQKQQEESRWAWVVRNPYFERIGLAMIYLNAIWIALDIEFNDALIVLQAEPGFIAVEVFFLVYFFGELIFRYMSYVSTRQALKDPWFLFDLALIVIMVVETWLIPTVDLVIQGVTGPGTGMGKSASVLRVARVLRVLRTARIIRVARYMPELMILIKGLMVAARSVFFTLVLLLLITYVFSIAFTQLGQETALEAVLFPSVPATVLTLIVQCVMPDQESFFQEVTREGGWGMGMLVLVFVLVGSLIVMNMLVGVLVEAVQTVATVEHEQIHIDFAKRVLGEMLDSGGADENGDNLISEQEFLQLLTTPQAEKALARLGVDVAAAIDFGKLLFEDGQPLTFPDFLEGMLILRGSNQTTVKDIVNLRKYTSDEFTTLHAVLAELCKFLEGQGSQPIPAGVILQERLEQFEKVTPICADEV